MWQELEHYIGRRTTGTKAGRYVLVPPGWTGPVPANAKRLDVSTRKVWLWGRLRLAQGEPAAPVHDLQTKFTLAPATGPAKSPELHAMPPIAGDELGFFTHLAFVLKSNEVKPDDKALFAQFARIGLTATGFDEGKLSPDMRRGILRALADGPAVSISSFASTATVRNGWNWVTGLDSFGFNYPLRAMIAGPYLGGNGEREAMYPIRYTDADGQILKGVNKYELKRRWARNRRSTRSGRSPCTVPQTRCSSRIRCNATRWAPTPGLKKGADGSVTIAIQNEPLDQAASVNWLPAPKGEFYVILRLYQPSDAILDGTWQLPQVTRVK